MTKTTLKTLISETAEETGLEIAIVDLMALVNRIVKLELALKEAQRTNAELLFSSDEEE